MNLKKGDSHKFYSSVSKAITGYLADKLALSASGLTSGMIHQHLQGKVSEDKINETMNVLRECDFHRFASASDSQGIEREFLSRAENLIMALEKIL